MKPRFLILPVLLALSTDTQAGLLDILGLGKKSTNVNSAAVSTLPQDQVIAGLKEALGTGVQQAIARLGQENGFLTNARVRIPMPDKLQAVERTLRSVNQHKLADDFVRSMNQAAEKAVPAAADVFAEAIRQISIEDARSLLTGTNNAATQYFRRATETNLFTKFLPIVKDATDKAGVTAAYKKLMDRAGGNSALGAFGRSLLGVESVDIDSYVTTKALDGLFTVVEEEEKRIRENPAARTSALLQKVFGAVKR